MPAFPESRVASIESSIDRLCLKMIEHYDYEFSLQQLADLVVPPELHYMFFNGRKLFDLRYVSESLSASVMTDTDVKTVDLSFSAPSSHRRDGVLFPAQPLTFNINDPALASVRAWLFLRIETGIQFGIAKATFRALCEHCSSPEQVRFFFPSVLVLLENSGDEHNKRLAERLQASKAPRNIPSLPTWVREGCKVAASALAAMTLLPEPRHRVREVDVYARMRAPFMFHDQEIHAL